MSLVCGPYYAQTNKRGLWVSSVRVVKHIRLFLAASIAQSDGKSWKKEDAAERNTCTNTWKTLETFGRGQWSTQPPNHAETSWDIKSTSRSSTSTPCTPLRRMRKQKETPECRRKHQRTRGTWRTLQKQKVLESSSPSPTAPASATSTTSTPSLLSLAWAGWNRTHLVKSGEWKCGYCARTADIQQPGAVVETGRTGMQRSWLAGSSASFASAALRNGIWQRVSHMSPGVMMVSAPLGLSQNAVESWNCMLLVCLAPPSTFFLG